VVRVRDCQVHAADRFNGAEGDHDRLAAARLAEFLADPRNLDGYLREARKKLTAAVRASRATLTTHTSVFGVRPVVAASGTG
jgi:hypothetical protein